MKFICAHCGKTGDKATGHVNRSRAQGAPLYCDRRCSGAAKRKHKTKAQEVEEKRIYDAEYRRKNRKILKAKKRAYFIRTYDSEKARIERKKRMPQHVEYCRRPEYRKWKSQYDRRYRSKRLYGPFAEAGMLIVDLNREIKTRSTNYEIRCQNQTLNKRQSRSRQAAESPNRDRNRASQGFGLA